MRRLMILAVLVATGVPAFATAVPANAAVSSASIGDATATLNLDGADDNATVSVSGGLLVHGQTTGGLASGADWDSATAGDQTVPADGTFTVVVNGGDGRDALTVLAKSNELATATLNGEAGDDVITGADTNDSLDGGDGDDRLVGAKGLDLMTGGAGNDTLVWNNGDGSDRMDGQAGNDVAEVNGSPTAGDAFTLDPIMGGVKLVRTNLVPFTLQTATERFEVNGLGGVDSITAHEGVGALTLLSVDGGTGADTVLGSDGPDLVVGGEGDDVLDGGGGDDRIVGDRGSDTMNGGTGDDTLIWNNGDGTDVLNGDGGHDDIEVKGSPTAADILTVHPNGARIKLERTNLVPFSLDIGSSETMHANGLGGDDAITVGDVGAYAVTALGGPGNDMLSGGGASETFLGGSGNDTIAPGGGFDVVSGDDGDDQVDVRDNAPDVAFGGVGNDSVVADVATLDSLDGFESVDRTPVVTPPPADTATRPVTIMGRPVKISDRRRIASVKLSCPADSPGNCAGSLALRTASAVKVARLRVVVQLGSARYDLAPGASKTIRVRLAKGVRRVADSRGRLRVLVVAATGPSGRTATSARRLTLAFAAATKRRR